ncbi:MAG: class I SAM-dependent methyltransferase [Desulfurellaceae bacterium]|nr:class I SAM-dependent methyltransferase [Desulfurellaceae bacterium]
MRDVRDTYISQVVAEKSFADVGGLWGTTNEKVSVAHMHGARTLTMIDVSPEDSELWTLFEQRRRTLRLPTVECVSADILTLVEADPRPQFDVVHCSGVLYHMPEPMRFLRALRKITREALVLTSAVTATRVEGAKGILELPAAAMLCIPALQGREREIVQSYWRGVVGDGAFGLTREVVGWSFEDFGPWWWLPTAEALRAMCEVAGFQHEDGAPNWNGNAYTLRLSVR